VGRVEEERLMAIKFEKIKPGMTLYERRRERMGNTTLRSLSEWPVEILEVDAAERRATVRWNGNRPTRYYGRDLTRLYDWSMYDESIAVLDRGIWGCVRSARKLTKAELAAKAAKP
jgi:hypothetical protein